MPRGCIHRISVLCNGGRSVIVGFSASITVTVNEHDTVLFDASVAMQVTVVAPLLKVEPDAGVQTTVGVPQLSVADNTGQETTAEHSPASVFVTMFCGQVIAGGVLSMTVTVAVQLLDVLLLSVTVSVTLVVPASTDLPALRERDRIAIRIGRAIIDRRLRGTACAGIDENIVHIATGGSLLFFSATVCSKPQAMEAQFVPMPI